jgi:hypothetical protein
MLKKMGGLNVISFVILLCFGSLEASSGHDEFLEAASPMVKGYLQKGASFLPFDVPMAPGYNENEKIKITNLSQLGFGMLPDRRIRFGGKTLQGVTLPKSIPKQFSIIKKLFTWYGPCLESKNKGYQLNDDCFSQRENEFLKELSKSLTTLRFKYIL